MLSLTRDTSVQIDAVRLDGVEATGLVSESVTQPLYFFGPKFPFTFEQDVEYTLSFDVTCRKSGSFVAEMDVYLVGTAFPTNPYGEEVATVICGSTARVV